MHNVIMIVMAAHILLLALVIVLARRRRRILGTGGLIFCALVPVFGPVCGLEMALAEPPDPALLKDMIASEERLRKSYITPVQRLLPPCRWRRLSSSVSLMCGGR